MLTRPYLQNYFLTRLAIGCFLFALSPQLFAQNADYNSEQVSTDYLFLKALRGDYSVSAHSVFNVPLYQFGAREQQKGMLPQNNNNDVLSATTDPRIERFVGYIRDYYSPLFGYLPADTNIALFSHPLQRYHGAVYSDSLVRFKLDASIMARSGSISEQNTNRNQGIALGRLSMRAMGSLGDNFGFFLDFSNGQNFNQGNPQLVSQTDPVLGRTLKFVTDEAKFFDRYIGYIQYQAKHLRVRFGRENISWGYSPIDNLVHSQRAPLMDGLLIDIPYKGVRFTSHHGAVDGLTLDGKGVLSRFAASHRLQIDPADWLSFSVSDMVMYSGRGIDFSYLNPLAFYVTTGLSTVSKSDVDNSLMSAEFAVRPWNGTMVYGSLLADDIGFSSLSDTTSKGNNNKYAFQFGASQLVTIGSVVAAVSAEYVRVTPFTYSHRRIVNSWSHLGAPLGYNIQPNSDRLALQTKVWFSPRTFLQVSLDYTRHGENFTNPNGSIITTPYAYGTDTVLIKTGNVGGDILDGSFDFIDSSSPYAVGNKFLRGRVSTMRRINIWFSSEVYPNIFADVRAQYANRTGGNSPLDQTWFTFEVRVGY